MKIKVVSNDEKPLKVTNFMIRAFIIDRVYMDIIINTLILVLSKDAFMKSYNTISNILGVNYGGDKIFLNGEDVTTKIREKDVTKVVSPVSSIKAVRFKMVDLQRKLAEGKEEEIKPLNQLQSIKKSKQEETEKIKDYYTRPFRRKKYPGQRFQCNT